MLELHASKRRPCSSEGRGCWRQHILVCSFPASSPYWRQRREESCSPPEAPTSWVRLLPPARAEALVHHAAPTAHHKDHLARDPPGETHADLDDARRPVRSRSPHPGGLPCPPPDRKS